MSADAPAPPKAHARWYEEKSSAWLYLVVADAEPDPGRSRLFRDLAQAAETQARLIAPELGERPPHFLPSLRTRLVAWLTRRFGPRRMRHALMAMKIRGLSVYGVSQPSGVHRSPHGGGHPMPTSLGDIGLHHGRGTGDGGTLRAAVFGANDGLVSNTCLIMGVAGASAETGVILLAGVAGLLAGAFSMAAGEYVSMRSQREMYEYQIALEREELATYPDEEAEELALIYAARGIPLEDARAISRHIITDPERALDVMAREELGLNPDDLGSPIGAAGSSFVSFALGAALPVVPFLLGARGIDGVAVAAMLSAAALFAVGATLALFSGRNALIGGLRMLAIGSAAAAATYGIGTVLGVSVS